MVGVLKKVTALPKLSFDVGEDKGGNVYALPQKITHQEAPDLAAALARAVRSVAHLPADAGAHTAQQVQSNALGAECEIPPLARLKKNVWDVPVEPKGLVVDAQCLRDFDSTLLVALIRLQNTANKVGVKAQVHHAPEQLLRLAQLYGVAELLPPFAPHAALGAVAEAAKAE